LVIAHSNMKEIEHPNTPYWVKELAKDLVYSIQTIPTNPEVQLKAHILRVLAGNGKVEKKIEDANHVFEASKYVGYFITTDKRILKKRDELSKLCSATLVKPSEFIKIWKKYKNTE